ncbi:MAG TPA: hypothetical protein VFO49_18670 [Nocardioides sp.]|nr:hypothetical protein [Nocardioides sp.]
MPVYDSYVAEVQLPTSVPSGRLLLLSAFGFLVFYLATGFVTPALASSDLPLPDDPASEARAWFAENSLATAMIGVCQLASVACLAGFVTVLGRARRWGMAAVGLMALSSATSWVLAAIAADASLDTVAALRTFNFITGGTAHVVALGIFVWLASRGGGFGRGVRGLAWVAVVPSVASLISLVVFEGAALILLGRLLCMIWTVSAAVSASRSIARGTWSA